MKSLNNYLFGLVIATFCSMPGWAADKEPTSVAAAQQRELIYCAGYMTHEEREAFRTRVRAARTPEEKAAVRQAHQEEMRARLTERGIDPVECEPQFQRERLRLRQRGGKP